MWRGNGPFHCLVTKKGRGLAYYAYPEGFAGDFAAWSLTSQQMPAWTGQLTSQAGGLSVDSRSGTARAGSHRGSGGIDDTPPALEVIPALVIRLALFPTGG